MKNYDALVHHLNEIKDLRSIEQVLSWDQSTNMPPAGAEARARAISTLSRMTHELFISEKTGALLDNSATETIDLDYGSMEASMVRVATDDYSKAVRLPSDFVAELTRLQAIAQEEWATARAESDFKRFQPQLTRLVEMARQQADFLGYEEHPYDALVDLYEPGITTKEIKRIFDSHQPRLVQLIERIGQASQVDDSVLHRDYDIGRQETFARDIVTRLGFDFSRGHQSKAVHPFATQFSVNDVRITTRYNKDWLNPALFGMMHEAGHGMYEQGVSQSLDGTILASGTSLGVHESQSRMWENIVGRSRGFWSWALPQLRETFPQQLEGIDLDTFYRAINKVEPSLIRVEADEATYNLHIILRFEIEQMLISGELEVVDLPDYWNTKFEQFFGIVPPNDAQGVLQDIHWSIGLLGYFPTYALGNLLSVQYYNKAVATHPEIPQQIASGQFDTLLSWLNENIHQHGRKFTSQELTQRVTGEAIQSDDYMTYLETKFGEIYQLS